MRARSRLVAVILTVMLLASAVALSSCGSGTGTSEGKYRQAIEDARTGVWKDINSGKASSGQVAILDGGSIVYTEAFGMADRATSRAVTTSDLYNSGSIGKLYCASAVMKLVDAGKVKLDTPVTQYLPKFKMADPRYKDITVRMLLDHQSGLPGTTAVNDFGYKLNPDFYSQVYETLSRAHLKAAPGYSAPYCNDGFSLAEMLVAQVSGKKYIDYVTDNLLKPLSLTRTGLSIGARPDAGVAVFYQPDTGKKVPPEAVTLLGAGGLSTTAEELVRFGDSFSKGGRHVLSQKSIDEMTKAQASTFARKAIEQVGFNPELAYGLGLDAVSFPKFEKAGIKVIGKGGDTQDFHSQLLVVPDKRIAVAVIEAGHGSTPGNTALTVLEDVLVAKGLMKKEPATVEIPKTPQPMPETFASFNGYYGDGGEVSLLSLDLHGGTVSVTKPLGGEPDSMIYNGGFFYSPDGTKIAMISVDGQTAMFRNVIGLWISKAQKIPAASQPKSLGTDIDGATWLMRNTKPWQAVQFGEAGVNESSGVEGLPGYIVLNGSKLIESPTFAGMTATVVRDLSELTLVDVNGQTWAQVNDYFLSPAEGTAVLNAGQQKLTIGKDGYNQWLKAGRDLVLEFSKPAADRVIVIGPEKVVYDSVLDSGKVFVPADSMIQFSGSVGDACTVTASEPAGS